MLLRLHAARLLFHDVKPILVVPMNRLFLFHTLFVAWITVTSVGFGTPPNVVMIIADDLSYRDLGFMGNEVVHTPNIDQLAARSARYPNGYVPMSVCRPLACDSADWSLSTSTWNPLQPPAAGAKGDASNDRRRLPSDSRDD